MIMATSVIGSSKEPGIIQQPAEVAVVGLGKMQIPGTTHVRLHTYAIANIVASLAAVETADLALWPYPYFMSVWTRPEIRPGMFYLLP